MKDTVTTQRFTLYPSELPIIEEILHLCNELAPKSSTIKCVFPLRKALLTIEADSGSSGGLAFTITRPISPSPEKA